jgi:hypothetical protein
MKLSLLLGFAIFAFLLGSTAAQTSTGLNFGWAPGVDPGVNQESNFPPSRQGGTYSGVGMAYGADLGVNAGL